MLNHLSVAAGKPRFSKGAYALGKMVYGKGWDELVDLLAQDMRGSKVLANVEIDCYGYGEAQPRVSTSHIQSIPVDISSKLNQDL